MDRIFTAADEIKKVIKGKDDIIEQVMIAILSSGHVLLEDIPGVGKTTLATAFSRVMGLKYRRMQFTPDVMPSDVSGFSMFNAKTNDFEYREGAVMCNLFLADEINRTSPKTQSALLEVMEEGRVTVDGVTRELPAPFIVIATQNPFGSSGTQRLPQSQMDRFLLCISMGYPDTKSEIEILKNNRKDKMDVLEEKLNTPIILKIQQAVAEQFVDESIYNYIVDIANATRASANFSMGISPRGSIAMLKAARAKSFLEKRDYVIPQDIIDVIGMTCAHRVEISPRAAANGMNARVALDEIISDIAMPKIHKK
ncbi:MAG: MoxR family ATPase [Firmicutes bacterium]|nr:MoxR family ATPase [Bacillota bacterium]